MHKKKNTSPKIYVQIRKMLLLGIVIALGLSLGVSFLLNLIQESRSRDQTLSSAAQVAANTPVLMEDIHHTQATEYIRRTVRNVPSIDVFAVYDKSGAPVAFYDLASGADDPTLLTPLSESVMAWFTAGNDTMLYNGEAPSGTDRCAYAAIYSSEGELTGFVMVGIYMRSIQMMVLRMLLFHLLACVVALIAGSLLSLRLSRNIKEELLGYEPDAFRKLFLQRMDILDALDEGLLAIDENKCVTYLNRAASEILQIDQSAALGQPLKAVYPRSSIPRVMRTGLPEYNISLESITHVSVLSDRIPLWHNGKIEGAVAIFRNRTEVTKLAQDLTGVQHIVEALRAYTHEFTNKLHVILGLLQLGDIQHAEAYVLRITETRAQSIGYISDRIQDPSVAALLIGKAYRAAELDILFTLDPASTLHGNGQYLPVTGLITVLGNLIENSFDAMRGAPADVPSVPGGVHQPFPAGARPCRAEGRYYAVQPEPRRTGTGGAARAGYSLCRLQAAVLCTLDPVHDRAAGTSDHPARQGSRQPRCPHPCSGAAVLPAGSGRPAGGAAASPP